MQQNTNSKWLHRFFVFLLAIMVVGSYTIPQSFGMFGAQEAKAAEGSPTPIPGTNGTIDILDSSGNSISDDGLSIRGANKITEPYEYQIRVVIDGLTGKEGRTVKVEMAEGLMIQNAGLSEINVVNATTNRVQNYVHPQRYASEGSSFVDGNGNLYIGSSEVTLKSSSLGYGQRLMIAADPRYHYDGLIEDGIKVTYTEPGADPVVATKDVKVTFDKYTKYTSVNKTTSVVSSGETKRLLNEAGARIHMDSDIVSPFFTETYEFKCPQGVTLSVREDAAKYFTDLVKTSNPDGTTRYVIQTKEGWMTYMQWGRSADPVDYTINYPQGKTSLTVEGVKTGTFLNGKEYNKRSFERTFVTPDDSNTTGGSPFVQYWYVSDRLNADKANGTTLTTMGSGSTDMYGTFGRIAFGNAGTTPTNHMTAEILFEDNVKVDITYLPHIEGQETGEIWVKTNQRDWYNTHLTRGSEGTLQDDWLTWKQLGFEFEKEWITGVRYGVGEIPPNTVLSSRHFGDDRITGRVSFPRNNDNTYYKTGTVELYETADRTKTTGLGTIESRANFVSYLRHDAPSSWSISAGKTSRVTAFNLGSSAGGQIADGLKALYICVPKGSYIDKFALNENVAVNGKWTATSMLGYLDPQDLITKHTSSTGVEYYRISFDGIPKEIMRALSHGTRVTDTSSGKIAARTFSYGYDLHVPQNAESGYYPYKDNHFVELEVSDPRMTNSYVDAIFDDPKGFGTNNMLVGCWSNGGLSIEKISNLEAVTKAKNQEMSEYINYDEKRPSTILPIGNGDTDVVNLRTTITNTSAAEGKAGNTVWIPIPKKGQNWYSRTEGCKDINGNPTETVPFSLLLQGAITNPDPDVWTLYYGENITPPEAENPAKDWDVTGDNNSGKWKTNLSNFSNVNCIKLVAKKAVPAYNAGTEDAYSINLDANVKVAAEDRTQKNSVVALRPLVYKDLTNDGLPFEEIGNGEPTAMTIARGKIQGQIFMDTARNGSLDTGDTIVEEPYKVKLYGKDGTKWNLMKETTVQNYDGKYGYRFNGLATGEEYKDYYRIEVVNGEGVTKKFRNIAAVNPATANELIVSAKTNTNGKSTGNAFIHTGDSKTTDADRLGYAAVDSVLPYDADNFNFAAGSGGHYNLGVYDGSEVNKTTLTFTSNTGRGSLTNKDNNNAITKDSGNSAAQMKYTGFASDLLTWPQATAKAGYEFTGWKAQGTSVTLPQPSAAQQMGSASLTYEAQYNVKKYAVNFDTNGASSGSIPPIQVATDAVIKGSTFPKDPTRDGYSFKGWKVKTTVGSLTAGSYITATTKMPAGAITLVAEWEKPADTQDGIVIAAGDFSLKAGDVAGLNLSKVIELAGASAWMASNPNQQVSISSANHSAIKAEAGTYDVEFVTEAVGGKVARKTVKATVYDNIVEGETVSLSANDFSYDAVKADGSANASLTAAKIKELSGLKSEGVMASQVSITTAQITAINNAISQRKAGEYPITFSAAKDGKTTSLAVTATLKAPTLSIQKSMVGDPAKKYGEGETVEFRLLVTNSGNMDAKSYSVVDKPTGMDFVQMTPASGVTAATVSGGVKFTFSDIPAKTSGQDGQKVITYTMRVKQNAATVKNSAQLTTPGNANIGSAASVTVNLLKKSAVSFVPGNGQTINAITMVEGSKIMEHASFPDDPTRDGYTFQGWYTSDITGSEVKLNDRHTMPAKAVKLTAKWEPTADMRAAMAVKDLIDALPPEAQITPEDGEQIRGAEKAYKDLSSEQQRLLDVLDSTSKPTLDKALDKLKEVEDQAAADAVTDKINALPAKEEVKLEDEAAITDARKAYDALTEDQKKLITEETLAKLTAAEEGLAAAKDAAALAKAKEDAKAELDRVNVNLYEEPELSVVKKAIEDGKKEIDASTTIPQVDAAKKKALDIIAGQKTAAQKADEKKKTEDPKNIPAEVTPTTPANLVAVTTAITTAKNDGDLKGSTYAPLKFMSKKQTKKSIKLQWSKVKGAKQYTVYGNQCGTKNKYKKLATVKGKTLNVKKVAGKKLKKGANYKFLIIAENGDKVSAISKTLHIRTAGHKKYTNYKSVSVKKTVIKKAKKLKKGKTLKLNAKGVVPKGKKVSVHVKTRYESANKKVATVTKAGKVKGIKKGKAKIYCYVQNGLAKVVTVTVK